jgi:SAM-dependent methyltransferase
MSKFESLEKEKSQSIFSDENTEAIYATGYDFEYKTTTEEFTFKLAEKSRMLILDPRPAPLALGTIYPKEYEPYQFHRMPWILRKARNLVQGFKVKTLLKHLPNAAKVLDIGCGNGSLLQIIKDKSKSNELHANDLSKECMDELKKMGFVTHNCSYEEIELYDYFDAIILNQVIEHFSDPRSLLLHCNKLLKRGGVLFIETPSIDGADAKLFAKRYWGGYHFPRHFYIFNEGSLKRLLDECAFKTQCVNYIASPAFWTQSFHHLLLDKGFPTLARIMHLKNIPLTVLVTTIDMLAIAFGKRTSNMRLIAKKI